MSELSQLGLDEGSVLDAAAHLGDAELQRLIYTLEQIIEVVSPKRFSLTEAKGLPSSIANLKKSYADDLAGLMDDLAQQGLSPKEFEKAVRPLVSDNFEKAFKLGSKRDLMPGDEEWLRRAVDSEVGYARDLADGVAKGATITPDLRANSYAAALDGVGWNGAVESMPEGTVVHWVLGQAEHCDSCILLAAHSPYDKYSLPTTPRAGDTDCRCITTPDSRVWTRRGMIPIAAVETGDEVVTHLGRWRKVLGTRRSKPSLKHRQAWVRGPFGRVVGCTHDHKFLTNCGWASAFFIEKAQLPMYAIGHELQSMWEEDQVGQQARDLQRMPLDLSDLRAKEGLSGRGVQFVRQASEGAVSVGRPIIQDAHRGRIASRWLAAAWWVRWATRGFLFSTTERWAIHRCVLGEGREAEIRLPLPVALDQGEWEDPRGDGGASSERRSYGRCAGESLLDAFWRACRISLQRGQESEQEEVSCQTSCRAADEIFLYDLEVEDDHSFIIEGLVAHNSNCKCRLVFKQGEDAGEPQDGVFGIDSYLGADEMPVPMQGEGLLDWLAPGEAPEGMMLPNATERLAMDEMYNEVNYNRRLMSQLDPDSEEFMAAVQARKEANGELIDYMEERGIWDKPLLSVDEVITGKDISMVAERDLFEIGLSGDALEGANAEVVKLVEQYKVNLGKKFKGGPK